MPEYKIQSGKYRAPDGKVYRKGDVVVLEESEASRWQNVFVPFIPANQEKVKTPKVIAPTKGLVAVPVITEKPTVPLAYIVINESTGAPAANLMSRADALSFARVADDLRVWHVPSKSLLPITGIVPEIVVATIGFGKYKVSCKINGALVELERRIAKSDAENYQMDYWDCTCAKEEGEFLVRDVTDEKNILIKTSDPAEFHRFLLVRWHLA